MGLYEGDNDVISSIEISTSYLAAMMGTGTNRFVSKLLIMPLHCYASDSTNRKTFAFSQTKETKFRRIPS